MRAMTRRTIAKEAHLDCLSSSLGIGNRNVAAQGHDCFSSPCQNRGCEAGEGVGAQFGIKRLTSDWIQLQSSDIFCLLGSFAELDANCSLLSFVHNLDRTQKPCLSMAWETFACGSLLDITLCALGAKLMNCDLQQLEH